METLVKNKYIKISNKIEIEEQAFTLIGASTKRGDSSKIGFFGSGLKYALAVILRNEVPLTIYSGDKKIDIGTKKEVFRGQEFNTIYVNGQKTSMTREMGTDWKLWFALREIYCNAIDEDNGMISYCDEINPIKGETHFYLEINDSIKSIMDSWDNYFSFKRKDMVVSGVGGKMFCGNAKTIIYRKGVQCYEIDYTNALYHYDLEHIKINESREANNTMELKKSIVNFIGKNADKSIIMNLFDNYKNTYEEDLYWDDVSFYNNLWLDVIDNKILIEDNIAGHFSLLIQREPCLILPHKMIKSLKKCFGEKVRTKSKQSYYDNYMVIEKTEKQEKLLGDCLVFLSNAGFDINHTIKVVIFEEKHILGQAKDNCILLSDKVFELGKKEIVSTLLEETFHIQSGAKDETREFQNYLIIKLINMLEEKNKEYL